MTLLAGELVVMVAVYAYTRIAPHRASIPMQGHFPDMRTGGRRAACMACWLTTGQKQSGADSPA
ncbi:hypothetical protein FHT77_000647 [Rhizobium sp. BK181]|uniref:hypothetical protein n=1 Tax=Rhizobium sp. BK181 TaxID=2587072 RepID=UPI00162286DC|nr:hypothetical protein [Rhizobium sp. BK181]MBB3314805.1 hypothetical protein [Rhizobium sp. BK181]